MGWTEYRASYFKSGKIDRKAECDAYFLEGHNRGHFDVLKSVVIGSVYYAAIKNRMRYLGESDSYEPIDDGKVWCAIFLTSISGNNFSYKDMDETMIPCYYDCPESILKLLSDTNNENALEYRRLCREKKKEKKKLGIQKKLDTKIFRRRSLYISDTDISSQKLQGNIKYAVWNGMNLYVQIHPMS